MKFSDSAWSRWLRQLRSGVACSLQATCTSRRKRPRHCTRQSIEHLELRTLLSVTYDAVTGHLALTGAGSADEAVVEYLDPSTLRVVLNGAETLWPADDVRLIEFFGNDGADRFENRTSVPALALGGDGADTLLGSTGPVSLSGGLGDDILTGGTESDSLAGGPGNDTLSGLGGSDLVKGGRDDDELRGGAGRDLVIGGYGHDLISGGDDDDIVLGGYTDFDDTSLADAAIFEAWTATDVSYDARVNALLNTSLDHSLDVWQFGVGGNVYDDYEIDTVSGDGGTDLLLAPADPEFGYVDVITEVEAGERVVAPAYTSTPLAPGPQVARPGYLETITDPSFGTSITRISGDPGTPLPVPMVNPSDDGSFPSSEVWGPAIRNHYVTDSAWNVDGTLISLLSVGPRSYRIILGSDPTRPDEYLQPVAVYPSERVQYRWSQNPNRPHIRFAFPAGLEDHLVYETHALTGERMRTIELPFNKLITSKMTLAFVNGQEHVALIGRDIGAPTGPVKLYIVNLDAAPGESPVLTSMDLQAGVTIGTPNPSTMRFSPDGRYVLLAYPRPGGGRSWRLLERGGAGTLQSHAQPALVEQAYFTPGNRADGFFAVNWGHPVFAYDSQFNVHVVGSPNNFDDVSVPGVETFNNNNSRVGSLLSYNTNTRSYRSLTDSTPAMRSTPVLHVTATNHARPGNVVAVFGRSSATGGPSGQLVSINLDAPEGPDGTVGLLHHRSSFNGCYYCQPHPVLSPDGTQLIFSSTWGGHQGYISTFVSDLPGFVTGRSDESGNPIDLRSVPVQSYGGQQDSPGGTVMSGDGSGVEITGNRWKAIEFPYTVTPDTVLAFDFQSSHEGEIQGIAFDTNLTLSRNQTFQIHGTQNWGIQQFHTYSGSDSQHYRIPVGQFFTGDFRYIVLVNDDDTPSEDARAVFNNLHLYDDVPVPFSRLTGGDGILDFMSGRFQSYGGQQDSPGGTVMSGDGSGVEITGNRWKAIEFPYTVTPDTVLEFDFQSSREGEIQGIAFDTNLTLSRNQTFQIHGTQNWGIQQFHTYSGSDSQHYRIPVGQFFTGEFRYIVLVNDDDTPSEDARAVFNTLHLYDDVPVPFSRSTSGDGILDFMSGRFQSYGGQQDSPGGTVMSGDGSGVEITGNHWKAIEFPYTVTPDTVLEFDFQSGHEGEIHGIAFDNDLVLSRNRTFQIHGTHAWGIQQFHTYSGSGVQRYRIPVGRFFTGEFQYIVLVNDDDTDASNAHAVFDNLRLVVDG